MVSAEPARPPLVQDQLPETRRVVPIDNLKAVLVAWIIAGHAMLGYAAIGGWPYDEVSETTLPPRVELVLVALVGPTALFVDRNVLLPQRAVRSQQHRSPRPSGFPAAAAGPAGAALAAVHAPDLASVDVVRPSLGWISDPNLGGVASPTALTRFRATVVRRGAAVRLARVRGLVLGR